VADFFPGFTQRHIATSGADINLVSGGGPPILLLHGYPQTHLMWRKVAPTLAAEFTLVIPDLRGDGDSSKPPAGAEQANYSKRALGQDQVETMAALGFTRFSVAGHDRGARVAHRLVRDHAERIERLALLDIVPTLCRFETIDQKAATSSWHWFFLIQGGGLPERLIGAEAEFYLRHSLGGLLHGGAREPRSSPNICVVFRIPRRSARPATNTARRRRDRSRPRPCRARPPHRDAAPRPVGNKKRAGQRLRHAGRMARARRKCPRPSARQRPFPRRGDARGDRRGAMQFFRWQVGLTAGGFRLRQLLKMLIRFLSYFQWRTKTRSISQG
jgi:pimeloyl-ACP methyl ester carboxylesterase